MIKYFLTRGSLSDSPPSRNASVNHPLTMVSWENGKEVSNILDIERFIQYNIFRYESTTLIPRELCRNMPTPKQGGSIVGTMEIYSN